MRTWFRKFRFRIYTAIVGFVKNGTKIKYILFFFCGVLCAVALFFSYRGVEKAVSRLYFHKGISALREKKDIEPALQYVEKAISFYKSDEYYRTLSEIYLIELNRLVVIPEDKTVKEKINSTLEKVMRSLEKAIEVSPHNYQNWFALGKTHSALLQSPIALEGSLNAAEDAYQRALNLEPKDNKDISQIYFFLSQIKIIQEKNIEAMDLLDKSIDTYSGDPAVFLQLGILKYKEGNYKEASIVLEKATTLVSDYADARYFLGLCYYRLGEQALAIKEFEAVSIINPDNAEVKSIINNLKVGKPPYGEVE